MKKAQIKKSVSALAMAAVIAVSLFGYGCGAKPASTSSDAGVSGDFIGTAKGFGGDVSVTLTLTDGAITGCTNVGSINTEYQEASLDTDGFTAKMVDQINNKMAAADNDAHLHTHVRALFDDIAHLGNDVEVEAEVLVASQRLTADLEQHALILELSHAHNLPFQEQVQIFTATILAYFCSFA